MDFDTALSVDAQPQKEMRGRNVSNLLLKEFRLEIVPCAAISLFFRVFATESGGNHVRMTLLAGKLMRQPVKADQDGLNPGRLASRKQSPTACESLLGGEARDFAPQDGDRRFGEREHRLRRGVD